jgi:hypothetical protein
MKITKLKNQSFEGFFVHITKEEALKLISSLSLQMLDNDSNRNREEFYADDGKYLTIAVKRDMTKKNDPHKTINEWLSVSRRKP